MTPEAQGNLSYGVMVFLILIGFGGCVAIINKDSNDKPLFNIEIGKEQGAKE